jgi:hypothetical protein
MKKIKILKAFFEVELSEKIKGNTQLILDEVIKICDVIVVRDSSDDKKITLCSTSLDKEVSYVKAEDIESSTDTFLDDLMVKGRKATKAEESLIFEHIKNKHSHIDLFELDEPYLDLIVFDISETNKLVHNNFCSLMTYTSGKKEIQHFIEKYNIRYEFVYDIDDEDQILDYDEDISSIEKIL